MTQIIQLDYEDLQTAIKNCLRESIDEIKRIPAPNPLPDRCSLDDASEITNLSKAQLYKETMNGTIPHEKYGKRLVFSRKALVEWIDSRTVKKISASDVMSDKLAKSAKRHLK